MLKKSLFIVLGGISFALGTVGIFIPLLPTVPFYLLTAYLWLNSSDRLYNYFTRTRYYQTYVQKRIILLIVFLAHLIFGSYYFLRKK